MRVFAVCLVFALAPPAFCSTGLNDPPPRAALMTIGTPDASGRTEVRGNTGAAPPNSTVIAVNLDTGHYAWTRAAADGSFLLPPLFAPGGTSVLFKVDPHGREVPGPMLNLVGYAGTILRVPETAAGVGKIPFAGAAFTSGGLPTVWRFEGALTHEAGVALRLEGRVIIESPKVDQAGPIQARPQLLIERLSEADGRPVQAQASFSSTLLTPTGLPIERLPWRSFGGMSGATVTLQKTPGRAEGAITAEFRYAAGGGSAVKPGLYRTFLRLDDFGEARFHDDTPNGQIFDVKAVDRASRKPGKEVGNQTIYGPIVRIGEPAVPRMHWMLLVNHTNEGTRGTRAIEDRQAFGFAPRVVTQSDVFIIPRTDASGTPLRYNLEPFLPAIGIGDRELPSPPQIPFRFPSGELRAAITHPDGRVTAIAPSPFVQSRTNNATTPSGLPLESGGGYPHDPYQLSTMNPAFEIAFEEDGKHTIRLEGWIEDVWGHRWEGSGTYEILVARALTLDTAVLPGAPFEVGDAFDPSMQMIPPVAADVEVRLRLFRDSDPARIAEFEVRGRANRFGHFRGHGIRLDTRGEYRVDMIATWRDPEGRLWAGSRTWGGVAAEREAPIVAHGMRGADDMPAPRPIWFLRQDGNPSGHIHLPFLSGDVMWAVDSDAAIPHITFADPQGRMSFLRDMALRFDAPPGFTRRYDEGEARPFLFTSTGVDPHLDTAAIDLWGYAYRSVQRPLVRVREIIGEESAVAGHYWRFGSQYGGQRGMGASGDRVNDFKFQYGAIVLRGPAVGDPQYAIYGSLFVLAPDDGPHGGSRVFPPFRGNGGGQDGGPLFTLQGEDVEMFLHLTGVRPGSILHRGERISFPGWIAPTVAAKVVISVTSPSGRITAMEGRANRIGWFYPPFAIPALEAGVWTASVSVTFEGPNTSGTMAPPYPTGGILGARGGRFHFYVVDADAAELDVAPAVLSSKPSEGPVTFTITPPDGLRDLQLAHTITMPGFLLEEGSSQSLRVVYDAPSLAIDFPNLDRNDPDGRGDTIMLSFLLSGTDDSGVRRHFARSVVIDGETLERPPQPAWPLGRRRSIRR